MKAFLSKIFISTILFFIFVAFLIINLSTGNTSTNITINKKSKLYFYIYDFIMIFFIILIITSIYNNGYDKGILESLFIWAFLVIATPIPEAGLVISLPLKRFFNFSMPLVQLLTSTFALLICLSFYKQVKKLDYIGYIFNLIMNKKYYLILVVSIISSVITTIVIEDIINRYFLDERISYLATKLSIISILIISYIFLFISLIKL